MLAEKIPFFFYYLVLSIFLTYALMSYNCQQTNTTIAVARIIIMAIAHFNDSLMCIVCLCCLVIVGSIRS